jgi:hypothetical protein
LHFLGNSSDISGIADIAGGAFLANFDRGEFRDTTIVGIGQTADASANVACLPDPILLIGGNLAFIDRIRISERPVVEAVEGTIECRKGRRCANHFLDIGRSLGAIEPRGKGGIRQSHVERGLDQDERGRSDTEVKN